MPTELGSGSCRTSLKGREQVWAKELVVPIPEQENTEREGDSENIV